MPTLFASNGPAILAFLEDTMDLLLIIVVLVLLFGGGGFYGYRRWR
jgi:hypothetical protein